MTYMLRDVPPELWAEVKGKAAHEMVPLRALIIRLLRAYVAGQVTV